MLTLLSAPDLYTASARFRVAFPQSIPPRFINPRNQRDKKQSTSIEIPLYSDGENESNLLKTINTKGSKRKLEITNLDHLDHAYVAIPAR